MQLDQVDLTFPKVAKDEDPKVKESLCHNFIVICLKAHSVLCINGSNGSIGGSNL